MGDRALVIFAGKGEHSAMEVGPTVYLHWGGSSVPDLIEAAHKLMGGRLNDVPYGTARFIGLCHMTNPESCMSLGVWNTLPKIEGAVAALILHRHSRSNAASMGENDAHKILEDYSHGDAGLIVVDVSDYEWIAFGGYLANHEKDENIEAA